MSLKRALVTGLLATCAFAQEDEEGAPAIETFTEGEITVHTVTVGLLGHQFYPAAVTANVGDKIMFKFYAGNHSVIQSVYRWPCVPRATIDGNPGFASGSFPDADDASPGQYNLTIQDRNPIFYYCGAPGSCVGWGMLGAINPAEDQNVTAQQELAKAAGVVLYPNQTMTPAAAASISLAAETIMPEDESSGDDDDDDDDSGSALSPGAIAGIVIGGVAGLALIGFLIFYVGRNRGQIKALKASQQNQNQSQQPQTPGPPPEMQVGGVTYVPAADPRALHNSLPPEYHRFSPDLRSKSPETVVSGGYGPPTTVHSPSMGSMQNRYSENVSELGFPQHPQPLHQPPLLHELYAQPESENENVERRYV